MSWSAKCAGLLSISVERTVSLVEYRFLLLKRTMHKTPQTFAEKFNGFFTPRLLIMIIGALLGMITARMLGF